jgi:hypothetical protein
MTMLVGVFGLPLAYLLGLVLLVRRGDRVRVGTSLLFFVALIAVGAWAIGRSRSSTAGIGFIFLPTLGTLGGVLGLGFAHWRASNEVTQKIAAWLCLAGALLLLGSQVVEGVRTESRNRARDDQYAAQLEATARERRALADTLARSPGRESEVVNERIRARRNDRALLLAALESPYVSADVLDTLADSPDLGIALEAVRNPNARAETLARVYRERSYPDYFFQALAAHPHTPPDILREIYNRPRTIGGLDIWFAGNVATPRDVLDPISRTTTSGDVAGALLDNPALDCGLVTQIATRLKKLENAGDAAARARELQPTLCDSSKSAGGTQ